MKRLIHSSVFSLILGSAAIAVPALADTNPSPPAHAMHAGEGMLDEALHGVTLRPDQKTQVDQLKSEMHASREATMNARKGVASAMADQIDKGTTLDRPALQPKVDAFADAVRDERKADNEAINKLHKILDPNQRAQVANTLETRMKAHERDWNMDERIVNKLTETLKLTPKQNTQVAAVVHDQQRQAKESGEMPEKAEVKARREKALEEFKKEQFSMESVAPPDEAKTKVMSWTNRALTTTEKILPILTPEQRKTAATRLRTWEPMKQ